MISSKSKKSFAIDDLLCNTNTEDQRPTRAPNTIQSSYNTINGNSTVHSDLYLANGNRIGLLSQQIDHLNSFNFHHYPNWPAPHMVLPNTFNSMVAMNDFMPFYSQSFNDHWNFNGCMFKRKGGQVRFTQQQTQNLEQQFNGQKYLSPEDRKQLAVKLKLSDRQVKTWFQNRRAKWRRSSSVKVFAGTESTVKNFQPNSTSSSVCPPQFAGPVDAYQQDQ